MRTLSLTPSRHPLRGYPAVEPGEGLGVRANPRHRQGDHPPPIPEFLTPLIPLIPLFPLPNAIPFPPSSPTPITHPSGSAATAIH